MKKMMMATLLVGAAAAASAQYYDATDRAVDNLMLETVRLCADTQKFLDDLKRQKSQQAAQGSDHASQGSDRGGSVTFDGVSCAEVLSACERGYGIDDAVDEVCERALRRHGQRSSSAYYQATVDGVELTHAFFPVWTQGRRAAAIKLLDTTLKIVNAFPSLRGGTRIVRDLRDRARSGTLVSRFRASDYSGREGSVFCFVTQPMWDACNAESDASSRRFAALGASFDARRATLERSGATDASIARLNADLEFSRRTNGRTFDPSQRPDEDSRYRAAWDDCKRIHDIFGSN